MWAWLMEQRGRNDVNSCKLYFAVLFVLLIWGVLSGAAQAADVSGAITSNTRWQAAQSPYVLHGEVVLDNNALLTIDPGVEVRMAADASFTLKKGALQAVGTSAKPILITSDAQNPQAGDWRQWRLTAGTDGGRTIMNHVHIEWGSGLVVESSAPTLNNLVLQNNSGPAISIDLKASPMGHGLSASGNTLNAIAVPSGTIRDQVVWGLVGIPYYVQHGLVQIGQAPLSLEPARLKLSPGVVAILHATLSTPAPAEGLTIDLSSSVPSVASVASRADVATGDYGADIELQANSIGNTTITASHPVLGFAATLVEVINLPALELRPTAPTIGHGRPLVMTLVLPQPAPQGGLAVTLDNSDSSVLAAPSSLFVPAGDDRVNFEVSGLQDGSSRLSAQADNFATALATVEVRGKALVLPGSVVVAPGAQTQVVLELTEPAPAGGLAVTLQTADPSVAAVPATATVPGGSTQLHFDIDGLKLGQTELEASASGYQGAQAPVRVDAIELKLDPAGNMTISEGETLSRRRVLLSKPAPQGGVTVAIELEEEGIASVTPAEVFVPEGQIYALTPLTVKGVASGETHLHLTAPGLINQPAKITVRGAIGLQFLVEGSRDKVTLGKGLRTYAYEVYLYRLIDGQRASGAEPVQVHLHCVAAEVCSTPETVTIPANSNYVNFQVTGLEVGSTQVEASLGETGIKTTIPVEVIEPVLQFINIDNNRTTSSVRDDFYIRLHVPGAYYSTNQYPAQALTVNLSLTDQDPEGVVDGIYSASTGGELRTQAVINTNSSGSNTLYIAQPGKAGTYRVSAEITGIASAQSVVQTVTAADEGLELVVRSGSKVVVGKGLRTYSNYEVRVYRLINGQRASGAELVQVHLRCVATEVCSTPETVTIPANSNYVNFQVTGLEVGSTQIEATAAGSSAGRINVEVITPELRFYTAPPGSLKVGQSNTSTRVGVTVPGAYYSTDQQPVEPLSITFTSTVPSAATVDSPVNWTANRSYSDTAKVTGVAEGSTTLTASAPGFKPVTSNTIAVQP